MARNQAKVQAEVKHWIFQNRKHINICIFKNVFSKPGLNNTKLIL